MNVLRRLSLDLRQAMLLSGKQSYEPISVIASKKNSFWFHSIEKSRDRNTDYYMEFMKRSIHTSNVNKDLESGLKAMGAGFAMVGVAGPGIGIGLLYGSLLSGLARNPSLKEQLFTMALMGTAFCETVSLFCFVVAMLIFFG